MNNQFQQKINLKKINSRLTEMNLKNGQKDMLPMLELYNPNGKISSNGGLMVFKFSNVTIINDIVNCDQVIFVSTNENDKTKKMFSIRNEDDIKIVLSKIVLNQNRDELEYSYNEINDSNKEFDYFKNVHNFTQSAMHSVLVEFFPNITEKQFMNLIASKDEEEYSTKSNLLAFPYVVSPKR